MFLKKTEMIRNQICSGFSRECYCGNLSFQLLVGAVLIEMKFIENWSFPDKRKLSIWAELSCLKSHWKEQTKSSSGNISFFLYTGVLVC